MNHRPRQTGSLGTIPLTEPARGRWSLPDFPREIEWGGRRFALSQTWSFPYRGVLAQYREARERNSMHMLVKDDGTYVVDHIDEANPERGHVVEHAVLDVAPTLFQKLGDWVEENKGPLGLAAGILAVAGLLAASRDR